MKIAIVHNDYGKFSGEEAVVESHMGLFSTKGHKVVQFRRNSAELKGVLGNLKGLIVGLHNPASKKKFAEFLQKEKPDIIHIHNLYPLINPCVLLEAKKRRIPVVMTVHNFRMVCPNGLFYNKKGICEKCPQRSYWECIKNNCLGSRIKSLGYAARNFIADKFKFYKNNVDLFLCLSEFQKNKLVQYGIPEDKCTVLPNFLPNDWLTIPTSDLRPLTSDYVAYVGRLSYEKGIDLIVEAARKLPEVEFKLAGAGQEIYGVDAPNNVEFMGYLTGEKLFEFYKNARIQLMASRCFEGFPASLLKGMALGLPSIVPNHGAMPEIIKNSGITFKPASADDLTRAVKKLWNDPDLCNSLGLVATNRYEKYYGSDKFYSGFMEVCKELNINNEGKLYGN